jgi:hypothetical protein
LWELILKIGIVGTYLRIGIVVLIFRNYGTLPNFQKNEIFAVFVISCLIIADILLKTSLVGLPDSISNKLIVCLQAHDA